MSPMIKTFTPNDVIRYFYQETSAQENVAIEKALIIDADLMDVYMQLSQTAAMLDEIEKVPSDKVINSILKHAKHKNVKSIC